MSIKSLHHFKPPPAPEQALVWLNRTLEIHGHVLEDDRKERDFLVKEAKLQVEQKEAYTDALKADREREIREKKEAEEKKAKEAAEKKKTAEDATRREKKKKSLGEEPKGEDVCKIAVRLPAAAAGAAGAAVGKDGKIQRAFLPTESLERVFDWLDVDGLLYLPTIKVVQTRPKKQAYMYPEDKDKTLAETGVTRQVLLLIESRK